MPPKLSKKEAKKVEQANSTLAVEKKYKEYMELMEAVKARFPDARFGIACFKTIDEITNKTYPLPAANPSVYLSFTREVSHSDSNKHYSLLTDYYKAPMGSVIDGYKIYMCDLIDTLIAEGVESSFNLVDFRRNTCPCEGPVYESLWSENVYLEIEGALAFVNTRSDTHEAVGMPAFKSRLTSDYQAIQARF